MFNFFTLTLGKFFRPKYILIVLVFTFAYLPVSNCFYCTESFCEEETASYKNPCPDVRNCTKTGYRTFLDPGPCNCCEYCFDYLHENDTCSISSHQKPEKMCGPHLKCVLENPDSDRATCQKIISGPGTEDDPDYCMRKKYEYEQAYEKGTLLVAQPNPDCDSGGNYAPRQCLPGSVCYCSNSKGERIFGLALPHEYQDCACARDVARLQEFGFKGRFPHCLYNGDYDELQCVVRTCFCRSHPETVVAMHEMNKLPCFDNKTHVFEPELPRYYIQECEYQRARIEVQIADAELQGVKRIVADIPKCDPDGFFAPVQSEFNKLKCVAPDGSWIDSYQANKFTKAAVNMNCYCARAKLLLKDSATGKPRCCSNGNYKPWQCIGSRCFCVDSLGRQNVTSEEVHEDDMDKLWCYPKENAPGDGTEPECDYDKLVV